MCDQCAFVGVTVIKLQKHKEQQHDESKFNCDQCNYVTIHAGNLRIHKASKHLGIRQHCDQCGFAAQNIEARPLLLIFLVLCIISKLTMMALGISVISAMQVSLTNVILVHTRKMSTREVTLVTNVTLVLLERTGSYATPG